MNLRFLAIFLLFSSPAFALVTGTVTWDPEEKFYGIVPATVDISGNIRVSAGVGDPPVDPGGWGGPNSQVTINWGDGTIDVRPAGESFSGRTHTYTKRGNFNVTVRVRSDTGRIYEGTVKDYVSTEIRTVDASLLEITSLSSSVRLEPDSTDPSYLVWGLSTGGFYVWDRKSDEYGGRSFIDSNPPATRTNAVSMDYSGTVIASCNSSRGNSGGKLRFFSPLDLDTPFHTTTASNSQSMDDVFVSPDGASAAGSESDGQAYFYTISGGLVSNTAVIENDPDDAPFKVAVSGDGGTLYTGGELGILKSWDTSNQDLLTQESLGSPITAIEPSIGSVDLFVGLENGTLVSLNPSTLEVKETVVGAHVGAIRDINVFFFTGLGTCGDDGVINFWANDLSLSFNYKNNVGPVYGVSFSDILTPIGRLISGGQDEILRFWKLPTAGPPAESLTNTEFIDGLNGWVTDTGNSPAPIQASGGKAYLPSDVSKDADSIYQRLSTEQAFDTVVPLDLGNYPVGGQLTVTFYLKVNEEDPATNVRAQSVLPESTQVVAGGSGNWNYINLHFQNNDNITSTIRVNSIGTGLVGMTNPSFTNGLTGWTVGAGIPEVVNGSLFLTYTREEGYTQPSLGQQVISGVKFSSSQNVTIKIDEMPYPGSFLLVLMADSTIPSLKKMIVIRETGTITFNQNYNDEESSGDGGDWDSLLFQYKKGFDQLAVIDSVSIKAPSAISVVENRYPPTRDGLRWNTPFKKIEEAIDSVRGRGNSKQIWVKRGIYSGERRTKDGSIHVPKNIGLYGGFFGYENEIEPAAWGKTPGLTVISGDLANRGEPAQHVITLDKSDGVVLNSFQIQGGLAKTEAGAGISITSTENFLISNCVFTNNSSILPGTDLFLRDSSGALLGCEAASVESFGTSVFAEASNLSLTSSTFSAVFPVEVAPLSTKLDLRGGTAEIEDCVFGEGSQRAIDIGGSVNIKRTRFQDQEAGVLAVQAGASLTLENCLLSGNQTDTSLIEVENRGELSLNGVTISDNFSDTPNSPVISLKKQTKLTVLNSIIYGNDSSFSLPFVANSGIFTYPELLDTSKIYYPDDDEILVPSDPSLVVDAQVMFSTLETLPSGLSSGSVYKIKKVRKLGNKSFITLCLNSDVDEVTINIGSGGTFLHGPYLPEHTVIQANIFEDDPTWVIRDTGFTYSNDDPLLEPDFTLGDGSPAIDAAYDGSFLEVDLNNDPRPGDTDNDIGCFEK